MNGNTICTDVLSTNVAVLNSFTITVVLMFNTSMFSVISGQNISTTGMVILVCTASLVDIASVQQECQY
jgi:hypothetical protein